MSNIINFPNESERDWLELESLFRENYKNIPDGAATFEECLPAIKAHWKKIFVSFSVQPEFQIPGPITEEQSNAIHNAIVKSVNLVADRLRRERGQHLAALAECEFKAVYFRRNPHLS
jgi:hypothetical protein